MGLRSWSFGDGWIILGFVMAHTFVVFESPQAMIVQMNFALAPDLISKLSPRQVEITALLVEGNNSRQIGAILSISPLTVKTHIHNAIQRLDLENRTQLIVIFVRWQIIRELNSETL